LFLVLVLSSNLLYSGFVLHFVFLPLPPLLVPGYVSVFVPFLPQTAALQKGRVLEQGLADQFLSGRLYACISSRPGQSGRCDGYILESKELEFYTKKLSKKKGKTA
jgi:hypothetical protein